MALSLIKEDGSSLATANSYASVADADGYFAGHLYPEAWTGASADRKAAALVMATRLIDAQYHFNGFRAHGQQALQWPRTNCPDPDKGFTGWGTWVLVRGDCVESSAVPAAVIQATCEMARELLIADRTAAPPGEGIDSTSTAHSTRNVTNTVTDGIVTKTTEASTADSSATKYSKSDTRPIISAVAQSMLAKYGALVKGRSGPVRLIRA